MPTPYQLRKQRIDQLIEAFKNHNDSSIDTITQKALELFPFITKEKAEDYAESAYRILKQKEG